MQTMHFPSDGVHLARQGLLENTRRYALSLAKHIDRQSRGEPHEVSEAATQLMHAVEQDLGARELPLIESAGPLRDPCAIMFQSKLLGGQHKTVNDVFWHMQRWWFTLWRVRLGIARDDEYAAVFAWCLAVHRECLAACEEASQPRRVA